MKIFFISLTLIIFTYFTSNGQTYSKVISDNEIKDFLTWYIDSNNQVKNHIKIKRVNLNATAWDSLDLCWLIPDTLTNNSCPPYYNAKIFSLDTIFSTNDFKFLKIQLDDNINKTIKWEKKTLKSVRLLANPKSLNDMRMRDDYWEFSTPIFSIDKNKCIVKISYVCGQLCLDMRVFLFEKKSDGMWYEVRSLYGIVS